MAVLGVALALCLGALGTVSAPALAQGSGYYVTFVARSCPSYMDIFANKARNDILESLEDLGPNTQYTKPAQLVDPAYEDLSPQDACSPLPGWKFTLGTSYQSRADTGVWGSLSKVSHPFGTPIVTEEKTPLLDQSGVVVDDEDIAGATTIELTDAERRQASNRDQLWAQGGVPGDPVNTAAFPGPGYGFGALRCATDNLNGDNVEYIYFPSGVTHVFCYGLYVKRPAPAGEITIQKRVTGAPAGENPSFPFYGSISYNPGGFQLSNGGSKNFYRAGGSTWEVTERIVDAYSLTSIGCTATTPGGGPAQSTTTITGGRAAIHLVAHEHVTCVYNNAYVPPTGNLTINKISRGGAGDFDYTVTPDSGGGAHRLRATTTQTGVPVAATPELPHLAPGGYTVRERSPVSADGHWQPVSVNCDGTQHNATSPLHVEIRSAQTTNCTFVNVFIPRGSISIAKITYGATGTAAFLVTPFTGSPAAFSQRATTTTSGVPADAIPDTPADATGHLRLGRYTIAEQSPPSNPADAWAVTSVECNGVLQPFDDGAVTVNLTRKQPGVHCAFSDTFTPNPPPPPPEPTVPATPPSPTKPDATPAYSLSDLAVTKQALTPVAIRGQAVSYRITVTNHGPDPAERVVVDDQPSGHAVIVDVRTPVGSCRRTPHLVCQLGTVKAHDSVVLTVSLIPMPGSERFTNRAVVGTATQELTLANNSAMATVRVLVPGPPPSGGRG
jgi:uncharacterized repeat protein (TIGR01451 family)